MSEFVDGQPIIRAITFTGGPREGSWLSVEDLRAYIHWLAEQWPADAEALVGLENALTAGIIRRPSDV